jgi:hypothetical protein
LELELKFDLPARWPLVPVDVAAFFLDRAPDEVRLEAESAWAWDIASPQRDRRELRIWRRCLLAVKQPSLTIPEQHAQVLDSFLPRRGLRGTELQNLFYCTTQHIAELDAAGLIVVERDALARSGPRASKLYSRDSIVNFLTARSLSAAASKLHPLSVN